MSLNVVLESDKKKVIKYRYILIVILAIIIFLLVLFLFVLIQSNKKNKEEIDLANENNLHQEEEIMRIALDNKKKEEEERLKIEEENAKGIVYLTFDDGPTLDSTPQILDILEQKNVKATFFVINYGEQKEELIKRENRQGHTVALHGYTHTYSEIYQSVDTALENFRKIQEKVKQTTGKESHIIRFPGGSSNTISRKYCPGVMTDLTKRVVEEGYIYFDWNVDSDDAGKAKTSEQVYNNVVSGLKENRANVVLMHDFAGNEKTINALSNIIDYGIENGYIFRPITEKTEMVTHSVNN